MNKKIAVIVPAYNEELFNEKQLIQYQIGLTKFLLLMMLQKIILSK